MHDGVGTFFRSDWTLNSYSEVEVNFQTDYLFGRYNEYETRGLDARARLQEFKFEVGYRTNIRRKWILKPGLEGGMYADGGRAMEPSLELEWTVTPKLNLSLECALGREINTTEWTANEAFSFNGNTLLIGEVSNDDPSEIKSWRPIPANATLSNALSLREPWDDEGNHYVPMFGHRNTQSADITLRTGITLSPNLAIQFYG